MNVPVTATTPLRIEDSTEVVNIGTKLGNAMAFNVMGPMVQAPEEKTERSPTVVMCGSHQQYTDVAIITGVLRACKIDGDIRGNSTALRICLNECCYFDQCVGISMTSEGTSFMEKFENTRATSGALS